MLRDYNNNLLPTYLIKYLYDNTNANNFTL